MRLAARTRQLERLLRTPPGQRIRDSEAARELVTAELLDGAVSLGCERHVEPGEVGKITVKEWLHRLSIDELERLERAALRQMKEEEGSGP